MEGWKEMFWGFVEGLPKLGDIIFMMLSIAGLCLIVFLNLFMIDVCEWVKNK